MAFSANYDATPLFAGGDDFKHRAVTVKSGAGVLPRGALLGRVKTGTASSAAKAAGNTGNGTLVLDASTPLLANAQPGVYTVRCITAGTNSATFRVTDPSGGVLGDVSFSGSGASATFADRIKFAVTDGSTDFVVGDGFDVTVAETDKYIASVATAIDGSADAGGLCILAADIDATSGDVSAPAYFQGEFAFEKMTVDASWTFAALSAALRKVASQIFVRSIGVLG